MAKIYFTGDTIHRIDIVSRCFKNKNNNCCETKHWKNAIYLLITNLQIHDLATLMPGCPSSRVARYGFVNNKQMAFLQILFHNNYCFYFQNIWIQCRFDGLCLWSNRSLLKQHLLIYTCLYYYLQYAKVSKSVASLLC